MRLCAWIPPQEQNFLALQQDAARFGVDAVIPAADPEEISEYIRQTGPIDVLLVRLPAEDPPSTLMAGLLKQRLPGVSLVAWQQVATVQQAMRLAHLGFDQVLTGDLNDAEASELLTSAGAQRAAALVTPSASRANERAWTDLLVGESWPMKMIKHLIRLVSPRRCTVLITGETGTGKEMAARAIHLASPRANGPMVSINCNAIPGELLESELFGHVRGAYTGAFTSRIGRFEQANRGTLFLDEIGDLPMSLQAKLLRILQEREFQRVGSSETVKVDVRIIAATNADLQQLVREGRFRQDLYYRLNVAALNMPPLRSRREDIPLLARHFTAKICANEQIAPKAVPAEILDWLADFEWPGNVRQLENTIESAVAMSGDRTTLRLADFSSILCGTSQSQQTFAVPEEGIDFNRVMETFERAMLEEALHLASGSKKRAAELLKLKRTTFMAKLTALDIAIRNESDEEEPEVRALAQTA